MVELRNYQEKAVNSILNEWREGHRRTLLVLPTGTGKTIVFAKVVKYGVDKGKRALILAHRNELLEQASEKLKNACNLDTSLEKAESTTVGENALVTVGSIQTLSIEKRLTAFPKDYFDIIVVDEAHHAIFGILMNKTGKDFSILVGFPILGAIGCIVLTIVFISNNSKLKKVNLNKQSANEGPAESAEIYVPELVVDFDNTIKFNFPELPFDEYKCPQELFQKLSVEIEKQHRPSIHTLQEILIDMEHHLGMKNNQSIITLEKIAEGKAGYIEKSFYSFNEITVGYKDIYDANSYLSILAHELSHAYQYSKGKQSIYSNENKTEKFTDALTFYLGFGELTENGKSLKKTRIVGMTDRETKYETQTVVLGYLEKGYFVYLSDLVSLVRRIYQMFLNGYTTTKIAKVLNEEGIPSPGKAKKGWSVSTLLSILTNEKYKGDALLQKTFTTNFLDHTSKKNEGEVEQYYVTGSHKAIIEPSEWDFVQMEIERRKKIGSAYSCNSEFSCRLRCGDCGGFYGPKLWHSNDSYKVTVWQCNRKFQNKRKCQTPTIKIEDIKSAFVKAFNEFSKNKDAVIDKCIEIYNRLANTAVLDVKIEEQRNVLDGLNLMAKQLIDENASTEQDQDAYRAKYEKIESQFKKAEETYNLLLKEKEKFASQSRSMMVFAETFKKLPAFITEWEYKIWNFSIDFATVNKNKTIDFFFKNGQNITISL